MFSLKQSIAFSVFDIAHIELSRSALENNISFIKKRAGKNVRISSVVKGNAYGHGIEEIVPLICDSGIDHFSVFSADEAVRVKGSGKCPHDIMIMGEVAGGALEWAIHNGIEFFVFDTNRLERALKVAKKLKKRAKVHIELETGMHRTGIEFRELEWVVKMLSDHNEHFELKGLCTHYAGAESIANYVRIQRQIRNFKKAVTTFKSNNLQPEQLHTSCSAGMLAYPKYNYDMVRIGIMQYGFWPSSETFIHYAANRQNKTDPLKRVISWKSKVMTTKEVRSGEFIGYGQSFLANEDMLTAVIPVGYSHGYSRDLSNQGRVLIHGKRVAVVGLVNMNMLVADISEIPGVQVGDEVVLIGEQGDMELSVAAFGELSNQVNYELLTRLPSRIPRKIIP